MTTASPEGGRRPPFVFALSVDEDPVGFVDPAEWVNSFPLRAYVVSRTPVGFRTY
ncbi:hypothetical protein ACFXKD_20650 [Nocardiopsis aegyptia]|uniref:hypothetical protein n=1 Tax=Nocardiopsis aegyptia TaxID=220378 RepID=UPI00366EADBA